MAFATALSSVSAISGASSLFASSAASSAQSGRRSSVVRVNAVVEKTDKAAPNPDVVPPNVLDCKLISIFPVSQFWNTF
jgi:hypothetical protein